MTMYELAAYAHLVGGVGLFVALGLEAVLVYGLRRAATAEQARLWLSLTAWQRPLGLSSLVTVLLAGVYMAFAAWGAVGWIVLTLGGIVLMMGLGAYNGLHLAPLEKHLADVHGVLDPERLTRTRRGLFVVSVHARAGLLLGMLGLMQFKPDLVGALLVLGVALGLGLASALPVRQSQQAELAEEGV